MATNTLRLNRNELAKFLPNQRAIVAFEKLFIDTDENNASLIDRIESVGVSADGANSNAFLALALIEAVNQLAEYSAVGPSHESVSEDELHLISEPLIDNVIDVNPQQSNTFDYIELNATSYTPSANQLSFNGTNLLLGGRVLNDYVSVALTNNSSSALVLGDVVGIKSTGIEKYGASSLGIPIVGICAEAIAIGATGRIVTFGVISTSTTGFAIGAKVYASDVTAGAIATAGTYVIGIVVELNKILVRI